MSMNPRIGSSAIPFYSTLLSKVRTHIGMVRMRFSLPRWQKPMSPSVRRSAGRGKRDLDTTIHASPTHPPGKGTSEVRGAAHGTAPGLSSSDARRRLAVPRGAHHRPRLLLDIGRLQGLVLA